MRLRAKSNVTMGFYSQKVCMYILVVICVFDHSVILFFEYGQVSPFHA